MNVIGIFELEQFTELETKKNVILDMLIIEVEFLIF
jgi:hypothetical protein